MKKKNPRPFFVMKDIATCRSNIVPTSFFNKRKSCSPKSSEVPVLLCYLVVALLCHVLLKVWLLSVLRCMVSQEVTECLWSCLSHAHPPCHFEAATLLSWLHRSLSVPSVCETVILEHFTSDGLAAHHCFSALWEHSSAAARSTKFLHRWHYYVYNHIHVFSWDHI